MDAFSDGLGFQPRVKEPESSVAGAQPPAGGPSQLLGPNIPDTSISGPTPLQAPNWWVYDFDPGTGSARATFNGEVVATTISTPAAGVSSFNTRTGAVVLTEADIVAAGGLANPSPTLSGTPNAPTAAPGTNSTLIATCQFVQAAINANAGVSTFNGRLGAVTLTSGDIVGAGGAPTASPAFTGVPTAPTGTMGDTSSQVATDAFVSNAIAGGTVTTWNGRRGAVALTLSDVQSVGGAPIASPAFTGAPVVPTAAPGTATGQAASTAFVINAVAGSVVGVSSFNTRTGPVVFTAADLASVGGAPLASPALTGTPTAPTPTAGDNSTKIATTAFVETQIGSLPPGVSTFNGRQGTVTLSLADVTSVGGAPLASPTFTGSPLTPTPAPGDNSTRVADTAFVTAAIGAIPPAPIASTTLPLMDGTAAAGSAAAWAAGDHRHPTDTSRAAQSSLANYLPLAGGTLTGILNGTTIAAGNFNPGYPTVADVKLSASAASTVLQWFTGYSMSMLRSSGTLTFYANGSGVASLDIDGSVILNSTGNLSIAGQGYKPSGGSWATGSDARIKTVQGAYESGLESVLALNPVVYSYKGNDALTEGEPSPHASAAVNGTQFVGLIAQEVETVFPGMVTQRAGFIDSEAVTDYRILDVSELVYALVNSVKTLAARVSELEAAR